MIQRVGVTFRDANNVINLFLPKIIIVNYLNETTNVCFNSFFFETATMEIFSLLVFH